MANGIFSPGAPIDGAALKEYIDEQIEEDMQNLKKLLIDAKEITLSFDYLTTEMLLDKMNKRTLEALNEHLHDLKLHVEKRLFGKV